MGDADDMPIDDECGCGEFQPDDGADVEYLAIQSSERLWVRTALAFIDAAAKPNRADVHERVRHAINDATIAACERAARIFRSDLEPVDYGDDEPELNGC